MVWLNVHTVLVISYVVVPISHKLCRRVIFYVEFWEGYTSGLVRSYCLQFGLGESLFIKLQKISTSAALETPPKQRYFAPKSAPKN